MQTLIDKSSTTTGRESTPPANPEKGRDVNFKKKMQTVWMTRQPVI